MTHIPHSTFDDEARFIVAISDLIKKGELPVLSQWEPSTKDEKAKLVRKKQAAKEAKEAEELAKELGVHDEFFGSGKKGARKAKGKGKAKQTDEEEDTSALQALILKKRKNAESEREYSALWMFLLRELLGLGSDSRPEVRDGAIQTLFRAMLLYGATLGSETWSQCIWHVIFPLLEQLTAEMRANQARVSMAEEGDEQEEILAAKGAWDESKTLALQSLGTIFRDFLVSHLMQLETFEKAWDAFVEHVVETVLLDDRSITVPALQCLNLGVQAAASAGTGEEVRERVQVVWTRTWAAIDRMGDAVLKRVSIDPEDVMPYAPFTQSSLVALVELVGSVRALSKTLDEGEWPLERLSRLMAILKGMFPDI